MKTLVQNPADFFKLLGDETRLLIVLLLHRHGELCVCDLTAALSLSQPKISRHLAMLRHQQLVVARREYQWVHYQLSPALPDWASAVLATTAASQRDYLHARVAADFTIARTACA